jgi:hypothetical protein
MRNWNRILRSILAIGCWLCCGIAARAQEETRPTNSEVGYRLRVENQPFGRVEVSIDGDRRSYLIGRVVLPATRAGADKTALQPGSVLRGGSNGLAFSVGTGQALKLLPYPLASPTDSSEGRPLPRRQKFTPETCAIVTDLNARRSIFNDLLPAKGTIVRLQHAYNSLEAIPVGYTPSEQDVFVFQVKLPGNSEDVEFLQKRMEAMARVYASGAVARAKAEKRTIVSGTLTLRAQLPSGEPDPIVFVAYALDGDMIATQNTPPFSYGWDTRSVADGEYVVEVRGLNQQGRVLTRARALVVVQNRAVPASSSP